MSELNQETGITIVNGRNGAYAQKLNDGRWVVSGAEGVLGELEPGELGYRMAGLSADVLHKLPGETPLYAGTYSFKDEDGISYPLTEDYASKKTVLKVIDEVIDNVWDYVGAKNKHLKPRTLRQQEELACMMLEQLTWQSPDAYSIEFESDIEWCFDSQEFSAYPMLFKEN